MHGYQVFFRRILAIGCTASVLALCINGISAAEPATRFASSDDLQRVSRVITTFEIARSHAQKWESNAAAQSLVAAMMDDLIREARLDISWKARLFLNEEDRSRQEPDNFEQTAIDKLGHKADESKQFWNADRDRVVSVVRAHNSCVNCHDVTPGDTIGYVSLTIVADR